jgi:hypothetical protein
MESLHGGTSLGVRGAGFVMFWDWESGEMVRRIDIEAKNVGFFRLFFFSFIGLNQLFVWSGTGS